MYNTDNCKLLIIYGLKLLCKLSTYKKKCHAIVSF